MAARLVLSGLENADWVWIAKVEAQIRSVYDYELAVIATVLGVKADDLLPTGKLLKLDLPALQEGER